MKALAFRLLFSFSLLTQLALAQYTNQSNETGMPSHGSFLVSDIDSVNLANGALHVQIPFYSGKMRGNFSVGLGIRYESKYWVVQRSVNPGPQGGFVASYNWSTDTGAANWQWDGEGYSLDFTPKKYDCRPSPCDELNCYGPSQWLNTKAAFMLRDGHGSVVKFPNRISKAFRADGASGI